jgi:hypothetical protein
LRFLANDGVSVRGNTQPLAGVFGSNDINEREEVMTGKKQKTKEQGRLDLREERTVVTMLDYDGSPIVTYSVVDKRAKSSRGTS